MSQRRRLHLLVLIALGIGLCPTSTAVAAGDSSIPATRSDKRFKIALEVLTQAHNADDPAERVQHAREAASLFSPADPRSAPAHPTTATLLGEALLLADQPGPATFAFRDALASNPADPHAWDGLLRCRASLRNQLHQPLPLWNRLLLWPAAQLRWDHLATTALLLWIAACVMLTIRIARRGSSSAIWTGRLATATLALGCLGIIFTAGPLVMRASLPASYIAQPTLPRQFPGPTFPPARPEPLALGLPVQAIDRSAGWVHIALDDEPLGWVPADHLLHYNAWTGRRESP